MPFWYRFGSIANTRPWLCRWVDSTEVESARRTIESTIKGATGFSPVAPCLAQAARRTPSPAAPAATTRLSSTSGSIVSLSLPAPVAGSAVTLISSATLALLA